MTHAHDVEVIGFTHNRLRNEIHEGLIPWASGGTLSCDICDDTIESGVATYATRDGHTYYHGDCIADLLIARDSYEYCPECDLRIPTRLPGCVDAAKFDNTLMHYYRAANAGLW